jgi:ribonucleoside-triphosphate reductase
VNLNTDIIRALKHQDNLLPLYTGGCVFHTFLGESVADPNVIKNFIMKAFTQTKIPFLSITPTFSICEHHGYLQGEHQACPDCGAETEIYTRVVGYYRPVGVFNKGKKAEYKDRECFDIQNTSITIDAESVSQMN